MLALKKVAVVGAAIVEVLDEMIDEEVITELLELELVLLVDMATEVRVIVLVSCNVVVVVPEVVSSAATREAPAARAVKKMFEICILTVSCGGEVQEFR